MATASRQADVEGYECLGEPPGTWAGVEERLGFLGGAASLAVSMLGTGIVASPYCFALCGCLGGPAALLVLGGLVQLSYASLIRCTSQLRVPSYGGLIERSEGAHAVPRAWSRYTNVALWLLLILATTACVLISAHIIRSVASQALHASSPGLLLSNRGLFATILIAIYPLCLATSLHGLSWISTYCSGAILAVVALITWEAYGISSASPLPASEAVQAGTTWSSVLLALPIFGCAMFGHMNIAQIYAELRPSVKPHASKVAFIACAFVMVLYLAVGVVGYMAFGKNTEADVVSQIAAVRGQSRVVTSIQALLASFIVLKTPLIILPLRTLTLAILCLDINSGDLSAGKNAALTLALLVCVYCMALALPDLGKLLELLGAVCVMPLCFVVPARLSWAVEEPRRTVSCLVMGLAGLLVSALSLVSMVV